MSIGHIKHTGNACFFDFSYLKSDIKHGIEVISKIGKAIFEGLYRFVTFPCRYIGSKTWSIPGIIVRTPYLIFKRVFGISSNDTFLGSGYQSQFERQLTKEESRKHLEFVSMAAFAHTSKSSWVEPFGYKLVSPKSLGIKDSKIEVRENCFFDPASGLKLVIAEKDGTMIVSFGARDSNKSELKQGAEESKKINARQERGAVLNLFGIQPAVFIQAEKFFKKLIESPQFKDKKIILAGQCLGGALAQFVSLKCCLKSYCYNSLQLGAGLQWLIDAKTLQKAEDYVTHVSIKGDYITDLPSITFFDQIISRIGIKTPGNFGKRFFIPSAYPDRRGTHYFTLGSFMKYLGFGEKAHPQEVKAHLI